MRAIHAVFVCFALVVSSADVFAASVSRCPALDQALETQLPMQTNQHAVRVDGAFPGALDDMVARLLALPEGPERDEALRYYELIECPRLTADADV